MPHITLKDVAKQAGVSVASVSNVLNGRTNKVSKSTALKITKTAETLGYTKNHAAASLKTGTSNVVLVLRRQVEGTDPVAHLLQDSPFFNDFLTGIERGASTSKLQFSFMRVKTATEVQKIKRGPTPLGVIVIGSFADEIKDVIASWSFKTVLVDNDDFFTQYPSKKNLISSHIDDYQMGQLAIEHLVCMGHRNIVLLFAPVSESIVHRERYRGIQEFILNNHAKKIITTLHESDIFFSQADKQFKKIQQHINDGATAILCMSDMFAISCYREAHKIGLNVPGDFSLTGIDNLKMLEFMPFKLTTINQHIVLRGYNAVMQIVDENKIKSIELGVVVGDTSRSI